MTAFLTVCALAGIALGGYLIYLVSGELRPSDTVIGMRQRYAREDHDTRVLFWFLAVTMFFFAPAFLFFATML